MMLGERPPRSIDEAVAIGERLSALVMAEYLESEGVPRRRRQRSRRHRHRRRVRQRDTADGRHARARRRGPAPAARSRYSSGHDRLQRIHARRPADHARPRRLGFLGIHRRRRAGCRRAVDLDRRRRHHDRRSAPGPGRPRARIAVTYDEAAELAYNGAKVLHPRTLAPAGRAPNPGLEQEQLRAGKARHAHRSEESKAPAARTPSLPWPTSRWFRSSRPTPRSAAPR